MVFCGDFNSTPDTAAVRHCLGETIHNTDLAFYSSGKAGVFKLQDSLAPPLTLQMAVSPTPGKNNLQLIHNFIILNPFYDSF